MDLLALRKQTVDHVSHRADKSNDNTIFRQKK